MRKIKECITDSMETVDYTRERKGLPLAFPCFLRSTAAILIMDCNQRLNLDYSDAGVWGDKCSGKAKTQPDIRDYVAVLSDNDLARSISQSIQFKDFLNWFIDQDEPENESTSWYDLDFMVDKWNEFAKMKQGGEA